MSSGKLFEDEYDRKVEIEQGISNWYYPHGLGCGCR
jgi:hypothetical protein